nr:13964_t:CDS:2 [Entrophospora candida]
MLTFGGSGGFASSAKSSANARANAFNPSSNQYNPSTSQGRSGQTSHQSHNRAADNNRIVRESR